MCTLELGEGHSQHSLALAPDPSGTAEAEEGKGGEGQVDGAMRKGRKERLMLASAHHCAFCHRQ